MRAIKVNGVGGAYRCEKEITRTCFTFSFPHKSNEEILICGTCPSDMSRTIYEIKGKTIFKVRVNPVCYSNTQAMFDNIWKYFSVRKVPK